MQIQTLVLNKNWQATKIAPWEEAFTLIFSGRAEIIEEHNEKIKTINHEFKIPSVIRMVKGFNFEKSKFRFSKKNVFARDQGKCQYCTKELTIDLCTFDHVLPKSRGGKTSWENIVLACRSCNQKKGAKTPDEARMNLITKPYMPKKLPKFNKNIKNLSWENYL